MTIHGCMYIYMSMILLLGDCIHLIIDCKPWFDSQVQRNHCAAELAEAQSKRLRLFEESQWPKGGAVVGAEYVVVGMLLPSGYVKIAIENDHRNSGFSHWKWWFSIVMLVYQRVIFTHWVCKFKNCALQFYNINDSIKVSAEQPPTTSKRC